MNGFGLWDSVISKGKEILASPIVLRIKTAAGEGKWQFKSGKWTTIKPHLAVYETEATASAVRIHTVSSLEYDGCMKVEMDLLPGAKPQTIERLWLEIPIKDKEAPLFHYFPLEGMRRSFAGQTPRGGKIEWIQPHVKGRPDIPNYWTVSQPGSDDGVIWTCRDIHPWKNVITSDFVPYIWLGGGERGICFFGDNDKGYLLQPDGKAQTLEREGDTLYLRIDLVSKPSIISQPRHIVFGLQASPTRPMDKYWRALKQLYPSMPGPVVAWGAYICANKYPDNRNWKIVDAIMQVRATGKYDRAVFEQFDRERPQQWKKPWGGKGQPGFDTWLDRDFWYFVDNAARAYRSPERLKQDYERYRAIYPDEVAKKMLQPFSITYFEEHASDVTDEEWLVYQDEWRAKYPYAQRDENTNQKQPESNIATSQQNFPPSYRDFCLYYANEWMKRGIGLYFDNSFIWTQYNPLFSDAYYDENGKIQPAAAMWSQRAYYKRIWQLMNELTASGKTPYPLCYVNHMTSGNIIPWMTWNNVNTDLEWSWYRLPGPDGKDPGGMAPFPHGLLLAETTGRHSGSYPHALFSLTGRGQTYNVKIPGAQLVDWGMRTVFEIPSEYSVRSDSNAPADPFSRMRIAFNNFGYTQPDVCKVTDYWEDNPAVSVSDPDTKWIMLARKSDKRVLLVLQSWHREDTTFSVTIDTTKLGFIPEALAIDVGEDVQIPLNIDKAISLKITLPGPFGTKVIQLGKER